MHRTTERFWECYSKLPQDIQELADKNFRLFQHDPRHPSLQFKRIGSCWSARAGLAHRALAVEDGNGFVWVWIGTHAEYDRMIRRN